MLDPNIAHVQLSIEEYKRYSRHLVLEEVGAAGQNRLKLSKVLIIGLGGLGSLASMYLVAAGVGQIGLVDYDVVSLSNLQRQILYDTQLVSKKKVIAAKLRLESINPNCRIVTFDTKLNTQNVFFIVSDYDLILDASDNFITRYLLTDVAVAFNIPIIYGAIFRTEGQFSVFNYKGGPTYRDFFKTGLYDDNALPCSEGGIIGGVAGVISSLQANESLKILLGLGGVMSGKILIYDFVKGIFRTVVIRNHLVYYRELALQYLDKLYLEEMKLGFMKHREQNTEVVSSELTLHTSKNECVLIDVRTFQEYDIMHLTHAVNIPLNSLREESFLNFLVSTTNDGYYFLVYCSSDSRSITAVNILLEINLFALRLKGGLRSLGF